MILYFIEQQSLAHNCFQASMLISSGFVAYYKLKDIQQTRKWNRQIRDIVRDLTGSTDSAKDVIHDLCLIERQHSRYPHAVGLLEGVPAVWVTVGEGEGVAVRRAISALPLRLQCVVEEKGKL